MATKKIVGRNGSREPREGDGRALVVRVQVNEIARLWITELARANGVSPAAWLSAFLNQQGLIEVAKAERLVRLRADRASRVGLVPNRNPWRVYVLHARKSGRVKIGRTRDAKARVRALHTAAGEPLTVVLLMPETPAFNERLLHQKFERYRVHREWFDACILPRVKRLAKAVAS